MTLLYTTCLIQAWKYRVLGILTQLLYLLSFYPLNKDRKYRSSYHQSSIKKGKERYMKGNTNYLIDILHGY